jgi:hypothetical protein
LIVALLRRLIAVAGTLAFVAIIVIAVILRHIIITTRARLLLLEP